MIRTALIISLAALVSACGASKDQLATHNAILDAAGNTGTLYVIHAPQNGCPDGWFPIPNGFLEKDGSYRTACVHGTGRQGGAIDYLKPGEAFPGIDAIWSLGAPKESM